MENIYEKISVFAASFILGAIMLSTGIELLDTQVDVNGCSISPDNNGCFMNRPIDRQRRAELGLVEDDNDLKDNYLKYDTEVLEDMTVEDNSWEESLEAIAESK